MSDFDIIADQDFNSFPPDEAGRGGCFDTIQLRMYMITPLLFQKGLFIKTTMRPKIERFAEFQKARFSFVSVHIDIICSWILNAAFPVN